jgi:hypothetical protein
MYFLNLQMLIELKLVSGGSNPRRITDLADVQKMIETLGLDEGFAAQLDASVRDKFLELWQNVHRNPP